MALIRQLLFVLAFASCAFGQFSRTTTTASSTATSPWAAVMRPVRVTLTNTGSTSATLYRSINGQSFYFVGTVAAASTSTHIVFGNTGTSFGGAAADTYSGFAWSGNVSGSFGIVGNAASKTITLGFRWGTTGTVSTFPVEIPASTLEITYGSNTGSTVFYAPWTEFTFAAGSLVNTNEAPKVYGSGILFIDNLTGVEQTGMFGSEEITLKPGYNAIPFTGELNDAGMPKAAPSFWNLQKYIGSDGQVVWAARMTRSVEGTGSTVWTGMTGVQIFAGTSGVSGPTVKVTNGANGSMSDYITLPAGMSKGAFGTLPGGLAAGSPGLPVGMTGGASGALPSGVLSGGTNYLPHGVTAGTTAGNTAGATAGTIAGTGVTGISSGPSTDGEAGSYVAGPSMAGMVEEGEAKGRAVAEKLKTEGKSALDSFAAKGASAFGPGSGGLASGYWTTGGTGSISGQDPSWLNITLPIAQWNVPVSIPVQWINLIRAILLWGVKIWFVVAVLKLLMR